MNLYIGTSGYSYKEWKGSFYPDDLPAKEMLHYYGERFRTVEINRFGILSARSCQGADRAPGAPALPTAAKFEKGRAGAARLSCFAAAEA
jgi:hypothetical protein